MTFAVILLLLAHIVALHRPARAVFHGNVPAATDLGIISLIFYYDVGLVVELIELPGESGLSPPFRLAEPTDQAIAIAILAIAPWLIRAGASLWPHRSLRATTRLRSGRRVLFYVATACVSVWVAATGLAYILSEQTVWLARTQIGAEWGPGIIVFYLPLHFLAFFLQQEDSRTKRGRCFMWCLVGCTVCATISIGQRNTLLIPIVMVAMFGARLTVGRMVLLASVLVITASLLLPLFKWQYASTDVGVADLVGDTIMADVARAPVLADSIARSPWLGTRVMNYPMAGYIYSALFFVPRSIAPFKGRSTAVEFTARVAGLDPETTEWGVGLGALEEIVLNGGILSVLPMLLIYGVGLGALETRGRGTYVALHGAALFLFGYQLPALLLTFGCMAAISGFLTYWCSERRPLMSEADRMWVGPASCRGQSGVDYACVH